MEFKNKPWYYEQIDLGFNYRMTDFQSALVWRQLLRYKKNLDKRKKNANNSKKKINRPMYIIKYKPATADGS